MAGMAMDIRTMPSSRSVPEGGSGLWAAVLGIGR